MNEFKIDETEELNAYLGLIGLPSPRISDILSDPKKRQAALARYHLDRNRSAMINHHDSFLVDDYHEEDEYVPRR